VSHSWVYPVDSREGSALADEDWKIAIAKRLGANIEESEFAWEVKTTSK